MDYAYNVTTFERLCMKKIKSQTFLNSVTVIVSYLYPYGELLTAYVVS